jgi:hypothetical protein
MSILKDRPIRKTVLRGDRSINLDTFETVVVSDEFYSTKGELLLIVRDVDVIESPDGSMVFTLSASHGTFQVDSRHSSLSSFFTDGLKFVSIIIPATEIYTALQGIECCQWFSMIKRRHVKLHFYV